MTSRSTSTTTSRVSTITVLAVPPRRLTLVRCRRQRPALDLAPLTDFSLTVTVRRDGYRCDQEGRGGGTEAARCREPVPERRDVQGLAAGAAQDEDQDELGQGVGLQARVGDGWREGVEVADVCDVYDLAIIETRVCSLGRR